MLSLQIQLIQDFNVDHTRQVECFEVLGEWWQREPKMPYRSECLVRSAWMFARRWSDVPEVDEAIASTRDHFECKLDDPQD